MPAYYDMLVSQSPPIYSHSPPTNYLTEYAISTKFSSKGFFRAQTLNSLPLVKKEMPNYLTLKTPAYPRRSCLVVKTDSITANGNATDSAVEKQTVEPVRKTSAPKYMLNRIKKKVVFADDQGYQLTEVRVMSEPSNMPPLWSLQFLAHVTQGLISPVAPEQWTIDFRQPASDYVDFRRRLEGNNVSLENVIVKEAESCVVGTVKVKNLSFHKEVIIRATSDEWKTHEDVQCTYSKVGNTNNVYYIYDTFSFKITLPPASRRLEFCVCYKFDDKEYWDNNQDKNYVLLNKVAQSDDNNLYRDVNNNNKSLSNNTTKPSETNMSNKYSEACNAKLGSWSEFSSWHHLETNGPYY